MSELLSTIDHDRSSAGLTYVYPVVSRRAGGVSIGINLNTNNACNWHCVYCQVPGLTHGAAPPANLQLLGEELRGFLHEVLHGNFMTQRVPSEARRLNDIALSGNGEPASAPNFTEVVELIGAILDEFGLRGKLKLVLISNGSLMHRPAVQAGLATMARLGGEIWFKLDSATTQGSQAINGNAQSPAKTLENLSIAADLCPTWLQTCLFNLDGHRPDDAERHAYRDFVASALARGIALKGIMFYGLARPSMQEEAPRLSALAGRDAEEWVSEMEKLGLEIRRSGV